MRFALLGISVQHFAQVAHELHSQYLHVSEPPKYDGKMRDRNGYVAPKEQK